MTKSEDTNDDVAGFVDAVAKVTKKEELTQVADRVREFDTRWGTGNKKK